MFSTEIYKKIYTLAKPYGRRHLALIGFVTILQGIVQSLGVASIFPFLALAADTASVRESQIGSAALSRLPGMSDQTLLLVSGLGAIGMLVLANGTHLLTVFITSRYTRAFGHWMRVRLLKQISGQEYSYFLKNSTGVMLKKINTDVQTYINSVLMQLFAAIAGVINVSLLTITLISVDPFIAIGAGVVLGGIYLIIYNILSAHRSTLSQTMQRTTRATNRLIQQFLGGIKPIKVHGVEQAFIDRFTADSFDQASAQAKQSVYVAAPRNIIEPIGFGTLIGIVILQVARGQSFASLLPGLGLMAMASYRLLPNIQSLFTATSTFSANLYALDEVYDEFHSADTTSPLPFSEHSSLTRLEFERRISLEELCFRYPTSKSSVLNNLKLSIPKNSSVAFIGSTGCGKSTLIDLILGLHAPTSGVIRVDDVEITRDNHRQWRAAIGYVPQDIFLLDDTVAANVAIGVASDRIDKEQLRNACSAAHILDFIENELPHSWETEVGERGVRLSGGQRQRIGLARALYHRPDVLILDEATSALDNKTEAGVMQAIQELDGAITMIIVAHRLTTIQWCNQVVELKNGSVVQAENESGISN